MSINMANYFGNRQYTSSSSRATFSPYSRYVCLLSCVLVSRRSKASGSFHQHVNHGTNPKQCRNSRCYPLTIVLAGKHLPQMVICADSDKDIKTMRWLGHKTIFVYDHMFGSWPTPTWLCRCPLAEIQSATNAVIRKCLKAARGTRQSVSHMG